MIKGVIFDMDGVITDNNTYHEKAWAEFCARYGLTLTLKEVHNYIFGRVAKDTLEYIFKKKLDEHEVDKYVEEKETIYRNIYEKNIRPLDGLLVFLEKLIENNFKLAMATSAPPGNVEFTFKYIPIRHYFNVVLDGNSIINGKPHPEIYLKAVKMLGLVPEECVIFEDSIPGILSARGSGAFVVGVSTTHKKEELGKVDMIIDNFKNIDLQNLKNMEKTT